MLLTNNPKKMTFILITNIICYSIIYLLIIFDLLFHVLKRNIKISDYFICPKVNFCYFHRSYLCGCIKNDSEKVEEENLNKFVYLYVYCSSLFEIKNKKIKFINSNQKVAYLQTIYQF